MAAGEAEADTSTGKLLGSQSLLHGTGLFRHDSIESQLLDLRFEYHLNVLCVPLFFQYGFGESKEGIKSEILRRCGSLRGLSGKISTVG